MKTNNTPCILTDQQEQLKVVKSFVKYTRLDRDICITYKACFCGCLNVVSCSFTNSLCSCHLLIIKKIKDGNPIFPQFEPIATWYIISKNKDSNPPSYHLNNYESLCQTTCFQKQEEVILLTDPTLPICSILTSEGTFHNVYNMDNEEQVNTRKSSAASTKNKNPWLNKLRSFFGI